MRDDRDKKLVRRRGNCWACDGTGRCRAVATKKSIPCSECKGTGFLPEEARTGRSAA